MKTGTEIFSKFLFQPYTIFNGACLMSKLIYFLFVVSAFLLVIFLPSCTQENMGIYYSLEVEKDLEGDKGLDDSLKVWELVRAGSSYYIAAGKVYSRAVDGGTWAEIAPPAEGMLSTDVEYFNGSVYALFRSGDGETSQIYRYQSGTAAWQQINSISGTEGERVTGLMVIGAGMYVTVLRDDLSAGYSPYSLYYTADGSSYTLVDLPGDNDYSVRIIFDGDFDGTNYWVVSGDSLFFGTAPGVFDTEVSIGDADGNQDGNPVLPSSIGGIFYNSELDTLFLSSKDGYVLTKSDPGSAGADPGSGWYSSVQKFAGSDPEVFYDFTKVPHTDYGSSGEVTVIVGSDNGYYEIGFAETTDTTPIRVSSPDGTTVTTTINYLNTKLADNSIRSFAYDPGDSVGADDVVFACTTSSGLWRNTYTEGASQRVWSRE